MRYKAIWFKRKFDFNLPGELFPTQVERLRGTYVRLESKIKSLSDHQLKNQLDSWNIKEQIGHLIVVEELWHKRIENYKNRDKHLFPADLENSKTKETDFNRIDIDDLMNQFKATREKLIAGLESFDEADYEQIALHPRLETEMRLIDLAYFVAEHDDHHLARIDDIICQNKT